jgi:hypothetical protein
MAKSEFLVLCACHSATPLAAQALPGGDGIGTSVATEGGAQSWGQ